MESMTLIESADLTDLEKEIEAGRGTFVKVGMALMEIRARKLYRAKFKTFEDYCEKRWEFSASRARYLCKGARFWEAQKLLADTGQDAQLPKTEREARRMEKRDQGHASDSLKPLKSVNVMLDATGFPVPENLVALFDRGAEVQEILAALSKIRCRIEEAQKSEDVLYSELRHSGVIADIQKVITHIGTAKPYAVCPYCQGKVAKTCSCCKGRGAISKFRWDTVDDQMKKIRGIAGKALRGASKK